MRTLHSLSTVIVQPVRGRITGSILHRQAMCTLHLCPQCIQLHGINFPCKWNCPRGPASPSRCHFASSPKWNFVEVQRRFEIQQLGNWEGRGYRNAARKVN